MTKTSEFPHDNLLCPFLALAQRLKIVLIKVSHVSWYTVHCYFYSSNQPSHTYTYQHRHLQKLNVPNCSIIQIHYIILIYTYTTYSIDRFSGTETIIASAALKNSNDTRRVAHNRYCASVSAVHKERGDPRDVQFSRSEYRHILTRST